MVREALAGWPGNSPPTARDLAALLGRAVSTLGAAARNARLMDEQRAREAEQEERRRREEVRDRRRSRLDALWSDPSLRLPPAIRAAFPDELDTPLFHRTRPQNLASILKRGILPRDLQAKSGVYGSSRMTHPHRSNLLRGHVAMALRDPEWLGPKGATARIEVEPIVAALPDTFWVTGAAAQPDRDFTPDDISRNPADLADLVRARMVGPIAEVWVGRLVAPQLVIAIGVPDDGWATRIEREARRLGLHLDVRRLLGDFQPSRPPAR